MIKLAVAVGAEAKGSGPSHARKAFDPGIPPAEIQQTMLLSLTTAGFPTMIAALKWACEVFSARE